MFVSYKLSQKKDVLTGLFSFITTAFLYNAERIWCSVEMTLILLILSRLRDYMCRSYWHEVVRPTRYHELDNPELHICFGRIFLFLFADDDEEEEEHINFVVVDEFHEKFGPTVSWFDVCFLLCKWLRFLWPMYRIQMC